MLESTLSFLLIFSYLYIPLYDDKSDIRKAK